MVHIVNPDFEITVTQSGAMVPGGIIGNPPTVVQSDLLTEMAPFSDAPDGKNILVNQMTQLLPGMILTLGCKSPGAAGGTGSDVPILLGSVSIPAGSLRVKCNNKAVHIKGDFGICTCSVTYTPPTPGTPVTIPGACRFEITDAGQDKAEAL